jgi:putative Holliday junction resolvase
MPEDTPSTTYNVVMRYLGVDPGGRRMGLALADDLTGVVFPLEVVEYRGARHAAGVIRRLAQDNTVKMVVVGRPTRADGQPTPACRRSDALAHELEVLGLEVDLQSEFLSTDEARRRARDIGLPSGAPVDHLAAMVLLEEYLGARTGSAG